MSQREGANSRKMCGGPSRPSPHRDGEEHNAKGARYGCQSSSVQGVQGALSARRSVRVRALLRPARGRATTTDTACGADIGELRRRIQGGPQNIWRYADFLPLAGGPPGPSGRLASRVGLPAGCTPLVRADRLAERLGLQRGVGQERRRQPDPLVQGPRRLGRRGAGARARPADDRVRLDRATSPTRWPPTAPRWG